MTNKSYTEEFKIEAVKQITERGHAAAEVVARLGASTFSLYQWVWRRQPKETVLVHSDQGSQFSSYDWQEFLKAHNLQPSMSRRGNCHDNAVAESFFQHSSVNEFVAGPTGVMKKRGVMSSTTSRYFTTRSVATVTAIGFRR